MQIDSCTDSPPSRSSRAGVWVFGVGVGAGLLIYAKDYSHNSVGRPLGFQRGIIAYAQSFACVELSPSDISPRVAAAQLHLATYSLLKQKHRLEQDSTHVIRNK